MSSGFIFKNTQRVPVDRIMNNIVSFIKTIIVDIAFFGIFSGLHYFMMHVLIRIRVNILKEYHVIKKLQGFSMILDVRDRGISRALYLHGTREKEHIEILNSELKRGDVVLDIGANRGWFAMLEATIVGPEGHIFALEPVKNNYDALVKNVALNSFNNCITAINVGIGYGNSKMEMYTSLHSNLYSVIPHRRSTMIDNNTNRTITIKVITLRSLFTEQRNIDLIRMDIEGYEVMVIKELIQLHKEYNFCPKILFESHLLQYQKPELPMRETLSELFDHGFYPKIIASNQYPKGKFLEMGYKPKRVITTDRTKRGMFYNISKKDALKLICEEGYVRAVLLAYE